MGFIASIFSIVCLTVPDDSSTVVMEVPMDNNTVHFLRSRLMRALYEVLGPTIQARAAEIMEKGMPAEQRRASIQSELRQALFSGIDMAALQAFAKDLRDAYTKPVLPEERAYFLALLTPESVRSIMRIWLDILEKARRMVTQDVIFLSILDEAMLPPMDPASARVIHLECLTHAGLSLQELRVGLKALRFRMPPGALLHPDAAMLLGIALPTPADA